MELEQRFERMRALSRAEPEVSRAVRKARLTRLVELLETERASLVRAMAADFGVRAPDECEIFELMPALAELRGQLRDLRAAMRSRRARVPWYLAPARAELVPEPLGVVGVLSPWNFPVYLALAPVAAALAAGNRVLLKPSELAPRTSEHLARAIAERFDRDELSVWLGDAALAARFAALPFDHLLFTGSTRVGQAVAEAAAKQLTPVTLELGGKSPAIVTPSADLPRAAARIMFGKLINAGQICIAPDYALVPAEALETFVAELAAAARSLFPRFVGSAEYTSLRSLASAERMEALVTDAAVRGARLVRLDDEGQGAGTQRAPVLVIDPPHDARVLSEELFVPVLPIVPYHSLDEAIDFVNARPRPLALYVFGQVERELAPVLARTRSGGVTVNDVFYHCGAGTLPFGGIGPSGMGVYHGRAGFDTFSHLKPVYRQSRFHPSSLLAPPYGPTKTKLRALLWRLL